MVPPRSTSEDEEAEEEALCARGEVAGAEDLALLVSLASLPLLPPPPLPLLLPPSLSLTNAGLIPMVWNV
jgi:hypothetical protein